jgi:hypothetical protein
MIQSSKTNNKIQKNDLIAKAFEDVPEAGSKLVRWYDIPYRIAEWPLRGWRKKVFPRAFQDFSLTLVNILFQFNVYDREKARDKKDRHYNLHVPKGEHIRVPSLFVVELYTANEVRDLEKSIRKNGWDKNRHAQHKKDTNLDRLSKARAEQGLSWWRLADIKERNGKWFIPDAKIGRLPSGFDVVSLRAVQIGSGLTALVARFGLKDEYKDYVDRVWHREHEPKIKFISGKLRVLNRLASAYENTQQSREQLHDQARNWISEFCPGYFSNHDEQHVTLDILLTDKFDPTNRSKKFPERNVQNAFRAVGINAYETRRITSAQLPGLLLQQADWLAEPNINTRRTWGLIGKKAKIARLTSNFKYYSDADSGVSQMTEDDIGYTLILLAAKELLSSIEMQFSTLRDQAQDNHSKFKVRGLNKLRSIIMDSSFTLVSIKQDIENYLAKESWHERANFVVTVAPPYKSRLSDVYPESENFHQLLIKDMKRKYSNLSNLDKDIRDILSTVADLGSSANNIILGRWAFVVATLSLLAAIAALASIHLPKSL